MNVFRSILPYLALLGGVSLGASSGLYIKSVHISSLALTAFRMGVPILVLLPGLIKGRRLAGPAGMRKLLWITSGVNAVRMFFFVLGYKLTSVGNAVVLLYLWPVFAMIIESIQARTRPDTTRIAIIALCFSGVVVMNLHRRFSLGSTDLLGSLSMTLAAALFAFTAINFKKALANCHETDALYFQNIVGTVLFTPFLLMEVGKASLADIGIGSLYGFSVGLVGFGLLFVAMKRLPFFQYSALAYIEVPLGVVLGLIFLGESLVPNQIVGALMVLVASFVAQRVRNR